MPFTAREVINQAKQEVTDELRDKFNFILNFFNRPTSPSVLDLYASKTMKETDKKFREFKFPRGCERNDTNLYALDFEFREFEEYSDEEFRDMLQKVQESSIKIDAIASFFISKGFTSLSDTMLARRLGPYIDYCTYTNNSQIDMSDLKDRLKTILTDNRINEKRSCGRTNQIKFSDFKDWFTRKQISNPEK